MIQPTSNAIRLTADGRSSHDRLAADGTSALRTPTRHLQPLLNGLLLLVDAGLAGSIVITPLLMGGRSALGELVLVTLAVGAAMAWALRRCLADEPLRLAVLPMLLLLAGGALLVLQLAPFPQSVLAVLSPYTAGILPLWNSPSGWATGLGAWETISLTPASTRAGLVLFLAYDLLFFVTVQRVRRVEDVERLLRCCALSAACMAGFGLVQLFTSNGKFFWFHTVPFSTTFDVAKGSFTNKNHFAHYLALGIGPLVWWLQDAYRRAQSWHAMPTGLRAKISPAGQWAPTLLALALGITLLAGLLSLSRGGVLMMFLAAGISAAASHRAAALGKRFVIGLAAAGLLIGGSLAIFGYRQVNDRLSDLSSGSLERLDQLSGRRTIWAATAQAIPHFALLGSGAGSFREVYPLWLQSPLAEGHEYTHAENCYLQVALETGLPGLTLVLIGIGCCIWWCMGGMRKTVLAPMKLCMGAIAASLGVAIAHAAVDFVWYVPSCTCMVAILAGCALRLRQLANVGPFFNHLAKRRLGALAVVAAVLLLAFSMIGNCLGPALVEAAWNEYQIAKISNQPEFAREITDKSKNREIIAPELLEKQEQLAAVLEQVVQEQSDNSRARLELAECYLRLFDVLQMSSENPMSLADIRDAALDSNFPTREALDGWLSRAIGEHRHYLDLALCHTRAALSLCPVQGRGYLYLAELCFLAGGGRDCKKDCVAQAILVRPFDGSVLYAASREAWLAGDGEQWLAYSRRAFNSGRAIQRQLIEDLIAHASTEGIEPLIDFIIRQYQPDLAALRVLHEVCAHRATPESLAALRRYYAAAAEAEAAAREREPSARLWLEAQRMHAELQDGLQALRCARSALASDPNDYDVHYALAACLMDQRFYDEAQTHLHWCLQRKGDDASLQNMYKLVIKGWLDGQNRVAGESKESLR
jgi:O-antigen ligase/tetratricopeptide (TPR) repeat protein